MGDRFGLSGKAALVIGGGQGIGEATCLALADAGCRVAVLDVEPERAESVANRIRTDGGTAIPLSGNALDDDELTGLVQRADAELGGLDVLVTVVGSSGFSSLLETSFEQWDIEQKINLRYAFVAGKAFTALKVEAGTPGAITFVSSVSGIMAAYRHAAYGAAKAGLIHLVKTMATEWAPYGIRVNSVAPGPIITPRLPDTQEWRERIEQSPLPMQRRGQVQEIANPILFLSSDMASYVTGQTLPVDGGLTAASIMQVPAKLKPREVA
ncbi:MAG: SDR family NAD(P)-dependent oxidoreductase [Allosphingosinicella sp.]|uniref:SDR family NAD(P)-dependent oxidoreductase n=1 Tax=Allosphingosinicella sp. TaxID=2823234 RepID=UPI003953F784